MRVMLLTLPSAVGQICPPIGLGYLAACVEKEGHSVKIVDSAALHYKLDDLDREIKRFYPDAVGMTVTTEQIKKAYEVASLIKDYNSNCLTILGGAHPTVRPRETLEECSHVDVVIRGEGEKTFSELLEKTEKNKSLHNVRGISFKRDIKIIENDNRKLISNLDKLSFPAYHLLPMNKYLDQKKYYGLELPTNKGLPSGVITTSRGCPYQCSFCASRALWGARWRARSPENVVEELVLLREKYGMKRIDFVDDISTLDKNRIKSICSLIKNERIDVQWSCATRVDLFPRDLAIALKNAGCYMIQCGIESGVQQSLDFLRKGFTVIDAKRAVMLAADMNLNVAGNFIIGIPSETKEMMQRTISFANSLPIRYPSFSILTPYPGTMIFDMAKKNNWLLYNDWSKYIPTKPTMRLPKISSWKLRGLYFKAVLCCQVKRKIRSIKT